MTDLGPLARVHVFPVRHHSPRSSAVLASFLASVRPRTVLIEGPDDATSLVEVLVDAETRPPVAILGYRTDGMPGSSLWPFAAYSPEYVAAKWGVASGAAVAFIDVPIARVLSTPVHHAADPEGDIEEELIDELPAPTSASAPVDDGAIDIHEIGRAHV